MFSIRLHVVITKVDLRYSVNEESVLKSSLGCLIVEIHDHRKSTTQQDSQEDIKRVVMHPTPESMWTDILLLNEEWGYPWTEEIALEIESQLLVGEISGILLIGVRLTGQLACY